jgi:hypothetical protein
MATSHPFEELSSSVKGAGSNHLAINTRESISLGILPGRVLHVVWLYKDGLGEVVGNAGNSSGVR